jgi:hypothetical protein
VVSDWPGKCGICNMGLVRRKRGEAVPLPSGVVARMQFSPYRLQLAGIRTSPVDYEPLRREVVLVGSAAGGGSTRTFEADLFDRDRPFVFEGQTAEVAGDDRDGREPLHGRVRAVVEGNPARARLEVDDPGRRLRPGMPVTATLHHPIDGLDPFRSLPTDPPPLRRGEPRSVYLCPEHPEVLIDRPARCPVDRRDELEPRPLLENQRVGWWCPMHPKVTADRAGLECRECGGMKLVPRIVTYRPAGRVLTVPESAVVDTGTRTVVYVERMPGMFDGVEVVLGPRCGDAYPVISGLEPGQRVATSGAFLIDAETRLNPSLAASYFGSGRASRPDGAARESVPTLAGPSAVEQALAGKPAVCPVTGKRLGSMGAPVRVVVAGRTVWLCCDGCEEKLRKTPEKYLSKGP